MSGYYDRIQGTDRLLRIRRLRKALFAGIVGLSLLLVVARMGSQGASIKPLFLPVNGIIEIALIMGFITAIVGLLMRNLEIRHAQRDGQRYLMAKSSMARAIRTAGFAIGLAVILLLAVTPTLAASLFSDAPQNISLGARNQETVTFTSPDPLGVSFVTHATVIVTLGQAIVTLLRNDVTLASVNLSSSQRDTLDVEPTMWKASASWSLVFTNELNVTTNLRFVLEKGVVPTLFSTVPFLLFLYGGTLVAWWIVLRPIRDRTKTSSLSVAANLEEDERVYDGTLQSSNPGPDPGVNPEIFNIAAATMPAAEPEAPPPPVRARPVPAPPPRVETPKPAPRPVVRQPETAASLATKAGALAAYDEALRLDPGHLASLQGRASCLVRLNRKSEAIEAHKRILTKDARNLAALRALVRLHADERRWRECLEAVGELLRLRPNESSALQMKGDALTNLGRRPEALAAYEEAAAIDPEDDNLRQKIEEVRVDVPGLLSRALIASASGNYPQALNLFDDIREVEPSNVNALIGKAVAYRRSGKPQ